MAAAKKTKKKIKPVTTAPTSAAAPVADGAKDEAQTTLPADEETLVLSTHLSVEGRDSLWNALKDLDGDPARIKKTRRLTYTLTSDERQEKRNESTLKLGLRVETDSEIDDLTDRLKRLKKKAEALDAEAVELMRVADAGHELREVECVEVFDPAFVIRIGDENDEQLEKGALVTIRRDLWERASDDEITQTTREGLRGEAIIDTRVADKTARQGSLFS